MEPTSPADQQTLFQRRNGAAIGRHRRDATSGDYDRIELSDTADYVPGARMLADVTHYKQLRRSEQRQSLT